MNQRLRLIVAGVVLLGGISLAQLFRHPGDQGGMPAADSDKQLVLRRPDAPDGPEAPQAAAPLAPLGSAQAASASDAKPAAPPTVLSPRETRTAPPDLPRCYPDGDAKMTSRWGVTMGLGPSETQPGAGPQSHRIVNGDTLAGLAQRYLGSPDRAMEIFAANRGTLKDPELLPVGVELKLPPRDRQAVAPAPRPPEQPLVPVRAGEKSP